MDRRDFLKKTGVAAASLSATALFTARAQSNHVSPSEKVLVGLVGIGGRGGGVLTEFASHSDVEVVGLADVDPRHLDKGVKLLHEMGRRTPHTYDDFRKLLDDPHIDVLAISTPDHWHAIPSILACQAGKDVYVEKPDGHNMLEGQRMVDAMRKHRRIVQLGTQNRSLPHMHEAMEYIRSGKLGRVLVAKAWESIPQTSLGRPSDSDPPAGVDYDTWLGPAPKRPYNPLRFHGNWRWFFDYGTGDLGNDGVHRLDYARWALSTAVQARGGTLPPMPRKVSAMGGKWYFDDAQEWPDTLQVNYEYASENGPGHILTYEMRIWVPYNYQNETEGAIVYGDQGYIILANNRWRAFGPRHAPVAEGKAVPSNAPHVRNFLDCVKSRQRPTADLETVGHPSSVLCHAANISWRLGRQLELDPSGESFVGDQEANALRTRPEYRKPWLLPEV